MNEITALVKGAHLGMSGKPRQAIEPDLRGWPADERVREIDGSARQPQRLVPLVLGAVW